MAIPSQGQLTLHFQTPESRAMLQSAVVLLHPTNDGGYFIGMDWIVQTRRGADFSTSLFTGNFTSQSRTRWSGTRFLVNFGSRWHVLAFEEALFCKPLFAIGMVGFLYMACCCTLLCQLYGKLFWTQRGRRTLMGLPLLAVLLSFCNCCTVDGWYVA